MSKLRDFFVQIPAVCGTPNAARWGWINGQQFDDEVASKESVFADQEESVEGRLETAFGWAGRNPRTKPMEDYARGLGTLAALYYAINAKDREELAEQAMALEGELMQEQALYPTISALLTVEEATTAGLVDSPITPNGNWA